MGGILHFCFFNLSIFDINRAMHTLIEIDYFNFTLFIRLVSFGIFI